MRIELTDLNIHSKASRRVMKMDPNWEYLMESNSARSTASMMEYSMAQNWARLMALMKVTKICE